MGIRETLSKHQTALVPTTAVIILCAVILIIRQATSSNRPPVPTRAFYTTDDGATFFADDIARVAPFDYGGKTAVRANVYECGGHQFVGYLQRYSAEAKGKIEAAHGVGVGAVMADGTEVKAPLTGDAGWINANKPAGAKLYAVHCPDGSRDQPQPVMP